MKKADSSPTASSPNPPSYFTPPAFLRPCVDGISGLREGDVRVGVSSFIPHRSITKAVSAVFRVSIHRAPKEIREIGFQRIEFASSDEGLTNVILHKASSGAPNERFNNHSGNIATVIHTTEPNLSVFDTGRGRIGVTRSVSITSLDDPDSISSIAAQLSQAALEVAGHLALVPAAGKVIASAISSGVPPRFKGTAA